MFRKSEGSIVTLTVRLFDADGDASTPTTLRYRIDDVRTGCEVVGWTSLTPAEEVEVTWLAVILNRCNKAERKRLTMQADAGLPTAYTDDYEFEVLRADGF